MYAVSYVDKLEKLSLRYKPLENELLYKDGLVMS